TYRARVKAPPPRCTACRGLPGGATRSTTWPKRRWYSKERCRGSSGSTCDCGAPSISSVRARGRSRSGRSWASPPSTLSVTASAAACRRPGFLDFPIPALSQAARRPARQVRPVAPGGPTATVGRRHPARIRNPPGPHTEPTRPAYGSHPGRARAGRVTGCRRGSTGGVRRPCRAGVLAAGARWGLVLAGPVVAGADGPVAAGAKGPVAAGAKGPVAAGAKGPVAAGAKGPVMAGAKGPVAAGADGPVAAGADGPVAAGARGPVAAGARGPVMAGVGGPVMAGVGGLPAPGPVGRIVTDGP